MFEIYEILRYGKCYHGHMAGSQEQVVKWAKGWYPHGHVWDEEGNQVALW